MDRLPILLTDDAVSDSEFEARAFASQSVFVVYDGSALRGSAVGFRVVCINEPDKEFTVTVQTADGTAVAGSDYQALAGDFVFVGEGAINVPTQGAAIESDEEFTLAISSSAGLVLRPVATGRIRGTGNTHVYQTGVYDPDVYQ